MYRIREIEKGFITETLEYKWTIFGIKKQWKPFLCYRGQSDEPYYYDSSDSAERNLLKEIKLNIYKY